jgi:hypothetical protein
LILTDSNVLQSMAARNNLIILIHFMQGSGCTW